METLANRMRRLRTAWGYGGHGGQRLFAEFLGISQQRWGNIENGHPLGRDLVQIIVKKCQGIDYNWLLGGTTDGLSQATLTRLGLPGGLPSGSQRHSIGDGVSPPPESKAGGSRRAPAGHPRKGGRK